MTLGEIRKLLFALLNKDQSGNSFTPESFNLEIQSKNLDLFNVEYDKLKQLAQAKGNPIYNEFANSSSLRILKRQVTKALNPVGVLLKSDLADFGYMLTGTVGGGVTKPASVFKRIDFVDNAEGNKRRVNAFEKPIDQFPIGIEFYNKYNLYPNDITKVNIDYIKIPSTPYYDYCIRDDNDREEYMPVGSYILHDDHKLYDKDNNVLLSGQTVTYLGNNNIPKTFSLSVEFEWESFMHIKLISMILTDMGVTIRDAEILKYGMAEEQKQQV